MKNTAFLALIHSSSPPSISQYFEADLLSPHLQSAYWPGVLVGQSNTELHGFPRFSDLRPSLHFPVSVSIQPD